MSGLECRSVFRTISGGVMDFHTTEHDGVGSVTLTAPGMGAVMILVTSEEATKMSVAAGRLAFDCYGPVEIKEDDET